MEQRRLLATTALNGYLDFPHVAQVCRIERTVTDLKSGTQRYETVFAVTSLPPEQASPQRLLVLNRSHWSIENRSHYVRDATFAEDRSRIRVGKGPAMMASLRNFAIALARLHGFTNIASALRAFATSPAAPWPPSASNPSLSFDQSVSPEIAGISAREAYRRSAGQWLGRRGLRILPQY